RPDADGARPHTPTRRAGPRGAVRVPQHERRLRGRRPDHRALPRSRGSGAASRERKRRLMAKVDETVPPESDVQTEQAARQAELAVPAEIAADSVGEYFRTSLARVKAGESGVLPVIAGLILISILFESLDSKFLTAGNLVNLLIQAAVFSLLAMGEVFVLLLGEIDLSVGFVAGLGGVIMADLASPAHGWPWWGAIPAALLACAGIGILQGTIITRIGLPSFVVTLAGLL